MVQTRPLTVVSGSFAQNPDFGAFPGADIRAMVGVAKHAPRAFLFRQRLCQQCDCSGVLATALSRSEHLPSARRLRWPQASTSTPSPAMSSSWAAAGRGRGARLVDEDRFLVVCKMATSCYGRISESGNRVTLVISAVRRTSAHQTLERFSSR